MRLAILATLFVATAAMAQPAPSNPDWPCQQRLIEKLLPGSYWTGPEVKTDDFSWHDDPKLEALINTVVDRDTPPDEAVGDLNTYIDALPPDQRAVQIPKLFGYLVQETNDERGTVISRIEEISQRQRGLGDSISSISTQIEAIPEAATGEQAKTRADLVGQRDFNTQAFRETQQTMRFACEVPGTMERRLGAFARALQGKLKP